MSVSQSQKGEEMSEAERLELEQEALTDSFTHYAGTVSRCDRFVSERTADYRAHEAAHIEDLVGQKEIEAFTGQVDQ